jgi:transposase-like protein
MTFTNPLSQIPQERAIWKQLKKIVFGKMVKCPDCGRSSYVKEIQRHKMYRCTKCHNRFSVTNMNWLKGMKISGRHLWILIWCWQQKINIQQANTLTKLSIPTVRRYYELFRDNLNLDFSVVLEGKVQMDEMFVKGAFVIGAKDIVRKRIKLKVVYKKSPDKGDAMDLIFNHVKPGSDLCTDGGAIYRGCGNWWPVNHRRDIHKKFQFGLTSEIEGTWAVLRTFIRRMYHHVTIQKLPKVIAEFEARFSQKEIFESPLKFLKNSINAVTLAL